MQNIKWNDSILDQYFDSKTMSVHFKAECHILQKKGKPWAWESVISKDKISSSELEHIINQLYIELHEKSNSRLEIDRKYSKVLQIWPYRIVIVYSPLSDDLEMTVVKPVKKLNIDDYGFDDEVIDLLRHQAKWILISWSPWWGKTTFAQALVEMYVQDQQIVKTIESPRDLLVDDEVVQYSFSYAPHSEIRDILLLSRPDMAIYDEVRNIEDFQLFKDLRLTGIWLVWVIHATAPVDSIQRFIWTIEMGVIPQVIDTVVYIKDGTIKEILQLKSTVKVPAGMMSVDLARPVIEVSSFLEKVAKYEIYTYGEQVVVMPLDEINNNDKRDNLIQKVASSQIQDIITDMFRFPIKCDIVGMNNLSIYCHPENKGKLIGKWWETVMWLESKFGVKIDVREDENIPTGNKSIKKSLISWNRRKRRR